MERERCAWRKPPRGSRLVATVQELISGQPVLVKQRLCHGGGWWMPGVVVGLPASPVQKTVLVTWTPRVGATPDERVVAAGSLRLPPAEIAKRITTVGATWFMEAEARAAGAEVRS